MMPHVLELFHKSMKCAMGRLHQLAYRKDFLLAIESFLHTQCSVLVTAVYLQSYIKGK